VPCLSFDGFIFYPRALLFLSCSALLRIYCFMQACALAVDDGAIVGSRNSQMA
jgi:hypothetical protein